MPSATIPADPAAIPRIPCVVVVLVGDPSGSGLSVPPTSGGDAGLSGASLDGGSTGTLTTSAAELTDEYDAVVFQHSLEHVAEPAADVAAARGLLRVGGLLLVSLPNFGSWQRRRFAGRWFHLDLPRHRTHFSPRGLELLLRRQGFELLEVRTSTSIDGLAGSLQYRLYGRRRFDHGLGSYGVIALSLALAPVSALANKLAGGGDILNAVAAKTEPEE